MTHVILTSDGQKEKDDLVKKLKAVQDVRRLLNQVFDCFLHSHVHTGHKCQTTH